MKCPCGQPVLHECRECGRAVCHRHFGERNVGKRQRLITVCYPDCSSPFWTYLHPKPDAQA